MRVQGRFSQSSFEFIASSVVERGLWRAFMTDGKVSSKQRKKEPSKKLKRVISPRLPTAHCTPPTDYIELHARSAFSFLEGASVPEELIAACQALEMPAMALLDRDGVYGSPRFYLAAKKIGVKAHIGAEITVSSLKSQVSSHETNFGLWTLDFGQTHAVTPKETFSLPVLVHNRTGYQNLCRLITLMKLRVPKHAKPGECSVTPDELAEYAEGLICLTGAEDGPIAKAFHHRGTENTEEAQRRAEWLVDVFGKGNVYAELQRHFNRVEEARNQAVLEIARRLTLPLLATNGVCHATRAQREVTDVVTCIRNHVRLETAGRLLSTNSERYLKSARAMSQLSADLPEAILNTTELSSRLQFTLKDLGYEFPKYPVSRGETMTSFLRQRTEEGARRRYTGRLGKPSFEKAHRQINHELRLIEKLKLEGYFLIVWDIVEFLRPREFSFRDAARRQTALSATASVSLRSIRSAWICCLNVFFPRNVANGPTLISTCRAATSASARFNMFTSATENSAPR